MKIFTLIIALFLLSSCDQLNGSKDNNPGPAAQQVPDPIPAPQPPPPQPVPGPEPVVALPEVSFGYSEWLYDGSNKIYLELKLNKPSAVPVAVDIQLTAGTALYPTGFYRIHRQQCR